ncbi:MAG TPA: Hsp20/alpha crystallin family protein [Candidatus Tectomicrobia bacterium]|jgi:HSP20 family protein
MVLIRWEPSEGLSSLRRELDRLFEDYIERGPFRGGERGWEPVVEVADTKDAVIVKAQVPGISKDNLQVNVTDHTLTLKGEMKEEEKKEEKNYSRQEFRYGAFTRTIPLPVAVQADKTMAQLKDGVLEVTMPKAEQAKVKAIPIQT